MHPPKELSVDGINQAVASVGLKSTDDAPTHVVPGEDGCGTNRGSKDGVKAILQKENRDFCLCGVLPID